MKSVYSELRRVYDLASLVAPVKSNFPEWIDKGHGPEEDIRV